MCIHIYSCIWEIAENQWYIRYKSWEYLFSNAWWLDLDIKNDIFDTLKSEVTSHRYISFPPKSYKSLINIFLFHLQIPNEIFPHIFPQCKTQNSGLRSKEGKPHDPMNQSSRCNTQDGLLSVVQTGWLWFLGRRSTPNSKLGKLL